MSTQFAAAYAALHASHAVADHWVQTGPQATGKARPGWPGRRSCAAHVATYTATQALALAAVGKVTGAHFRPTRVAAGLAVSAVSHYWADRRTTLAGLVDLLDRTIVPGQADYYYLRDGARPLDQAWHTGWLLVAALVIGGGR